MINKCDTEVSRISLIVIPEEMNSIVSNLGLGWELLMGSYGKVSELRQRRLWEFLGVIKDNPEIFYNELLESEEFQDAFVLSVQKYISERNETKRKYIKNIFFDYSKSENKEEFDLERMYHVISLITNRGIELLNILKDIKYSKSLSESFVNHLVNDSSNNPEKYKEYYTFLRDNNIRKIWIDAEEDLISIGILVQYNISGIGFESSHFEYNFTNFGKRFIEFIKN